MILLLDADKEAIHYCLKDNDRTLQQGKEREIGLLKERLCRFDKDHEIEDGWVSSAKWRRRYRPISDGTNGIAGGAYRRGPVFWSQ